MISLENTVSSNLPIVIRLLTKDDIEIKKIIDDITMVHIKTFKGFFLTSLGKGFLRTMYMGFYEHKQSGLIVAEKEGSVIGFLAYSNDLSGFYKWLIKSKLIVFVWYGFCTFLVKPSIIIHLLRAFLKPSESKRKEAYVELSSIGVSPDEKNHHIGSRLISVLKEQFDANKFAYIKLETDAENNDSVDFFYQKNSFIRDHVYVTPEGRKMNEYRWHP